jgi:TPR repeat protein
MANRQELGIIRGARSGDSSAQLELGKRYLFGSAGLPQSAPTALHWLARASQQGCAEAWLLIGAHIPFEAARHGVPAPLQWYERAYDAGLAQAGLVFAQLVLASDQTEGAPLRDKALRALALAARAGLADAQWLLAQQSGADVAPCPEPGSAADLAAGSQPQSASARWLAQAADNGVPAALHMLTEQAWKEGDWAAFLQRALPMARLLADDREADAGEHKQTQITPQEVLLLSRCVQALGNPALVHDAGPAEIDRFGELAAAGGDRAAQLALGLRLARMDGNGARMQAGIGSANFKRAIRWLTQAGEQGLAEAWFALSRIYVKPEFSQRSVLQAQSYLERAADMGHSAAQLECGIYAWRTRRDGDNHDVRAAYWLLKAAAQGCLEAEAALRKIAPDAGPVQWAGPLEPQVLQELGYSQPLLAARLELAACFKLSRAEALLLDMNAADLGHCLLVDISASYGRSKRRLVLLRTTRERRVLDRIMKVFDGVDCSLAGREGNYRQRLYRLKTCLAHMRPDPGPGHRLLPA